MSKEGIKLTILIILIMFWLYVLLWEANFVLAVLGIITICLGYDVVSRDARDNNKQRKIKYNNVDKSDN